MLFIFLTFATALFVEALGTLVSVKGAGSFFGGNAIIIALVLSLDVGKIVLVSLVYKYWKPLPALMKAVGIPMIAVMMVFTSGSAAGFLSGEFQKAMIGTKEGSAKVELLKAEQTKLEARKKQIDDQIANLPSNYSKSRVTLMKQFEDEQKRLTARTAEIDKELPTLQVQQIGTEAKAGPIIAMASAFNITVEQAVKYVILLIIFVFDPLAVFLIISGNFLLEQRRLKKEAETIEPDCAEEPVEEPVEEPASRGRNETMDALVKVANISPQFSFEPAVEAVKDAITVQQPEPSEPVPEPFHQKLMVEPVQQEEAPREVITKSMLGKVVADPKTIVNAITKPPKR